MICLDQLLSPDRRSGSFCVDASGRIPGQIELEWIPASHEQGAPIQADVPILLFSSGFMTEHDSEWTAFMQASFSDCHLVRVRWQSDDLRTLMRDSFQRLTLEQLGQQVATQVASRALTSFIPVVGPLLALKTSYDTMQLYREISLARGRWVKAREEAEAAGAALAERLMAAQTPTRPAGAPSTPRVILVGHSLGARLMAHCLHRTAPGLVHTACFMGGALDAASPIVDTLHAKVQVPPMNLHSAQDDVLQWLYKLGNLDTRDAMGRRQIGTPRGFRDIDMSATVKGHSQYCHNATVASTLRNQCLAEIQRWAT